MFNVSVDLVGTSSVNDAATQLIDADPGGVINLVMVKNSGLPTVYWLFKSGAAPSRADVLNDGFPVGVLGSTDALVKWPDSAIDASCIYLAISGSALVTANVRAMG